MGKLAQDVNVPISGPDRKSIEKNQNFSTSTQISQADRPVCSDLISNSNAVRQPEKREKLRARRISMLARKSQKIFLGDRIGIRRPEGNFVFLREARNSERENHQGKANVR
ncbi:hypothetical protein PCH_Pc24g01080 [Penicillium rubens Wisconsin 54-1255]|uniref:Uncharacterized protein n=1 Tax=Penicillium rubens (strain ATCC 28089 / DSM 1075 / NRRL 1951 / Wisconsin 54-1255) TaxID=500485 RepID=B6HWR5_PENRW|nr:hypothetical protein PCH_Pc24g01080 [Penicillium rubens Wisconsin 54-1255]